MKNKKPEVGKQGGNSLALLYSFPPFPPVSILYVILFIHWIWRSPVFFGIIDIY